jgi:pimeloyl-ACP methyl ester carboxylesterase
MHFDGLAKVLVKEGFTVLTFDLMGRGHSPFPSKVVNEHGKSVFGAEDHIEQVRELITGLGLDRRKYHLIGHSMGGVLSALYASQYGAEEVLSLTLLAPAGLIDLGPLRLVRNNTCLHGVVRNMLRRNSEKAFRSDFYQHKGEALKTENESVERMLAINRQYPHVFEAFWLCALHFPLSGNEVPFAALAKHHHIRTMLMWGDKDTAVPMAPSMKRYTDIYKAAGHPGLQTKVYKKAAHGFFLEYAEEFHADMVAFLKEGNGAPSNASRV